jgi:hypothetical protein
MTDNQKLFYNNVLIVLHFLREILHNRFLVSRKSLGSLKYFSKPYSTDFTSLLIVIYFWFRSSSFGTRMTRMKLMDTDFINLMLLFTVMPAGQIASQLPFWLL